MKFVTQKSLKSLFGILALLQLSLRPTSAKKSYYVDTSVYGMSMQRDWMYESGSVNMKYEGCVWGYVDDRENMGCMADESEDGTTYWYMMANCRRAQVAYSVYASTNTQNTKCNNGNWKESVSSFSWWHM